MPAGAPTGAGAPADTTTVVKKVAFSLRWLERVPPARHGSRKHLQCKQLQQMLEALHDETKNMVC